MKEKEEVAHSLLSGLVGIGGQREETVYAEVVDRELKTEKNEEGDGNTMLVVDEDSDQEEMEQGYNVGRGSKRKRNTLEEID